MNNRIYFSVINIIIGEEVFIMAKITADMTIYEVLQLEPDIGPVFFEFGMHCLGCPISRGETVAEAAAAHGVDAQVMLDKLNEFAESHE